jgi:cytochrome P450
MATHHLNTRADIEAALVAPMLVPPPPEASLGTGSTRRLRSAMARFSAGSVHAERRAVVDNLVATIELSAVEASATELTTELVGRRLDMDVVASTVPVAALATVLGLSATETLVDDVALVAGAVGAGVGVVDATERATERLMAACGGWDDASVARASLLYQTYGATRALLLASAAAGVSHRAPVGAREPAVAITRRAALESTMVGVHRVEPGDEVMLEIGSTGLEFGHGPHACPGQAIAFAICDGVAAAVGGSQ